MRLNAQASIMIDWNFSRSYSFFKAARCRQFNTGRNYARDHKFQMDAPFNSYDQYHDRLAGCGGSTANAHASEEDELYAGRGRGKFFRCPYPHEPGKAWSDETTGGLAGRTLRPK